VIEAYRMNWKNAQTCPEQEITGVLEALFL